MASQPRPGSSIRSARDVRGKLMSVAQLFGAECVRVLLRVASSSEGGTVKSCVGETQRPAGEGAAPLRLKGSF
eukprot:9973798-Alexandrium_andersonii.AAC.1